MENRLIHAVSTAFLMKVCSDNGSPFSFLFFVFVSADAFTPYSICRKFDTVSVHLDAEIG